MVTQFLEGYPLEGVAPSVGTVTVTCSARRHNPGQRGRVVDASGCYDGRRTLLERILGLHKTRLRLIALLTIKTTFTCTHQLNVRTRYVRDQYYLSLPHFHLCLLLI